MSEDCCDEDWGSDDYYEEEGLYCDYDVSEFCEDPQCKGMGLCTTECKAYLDACERDNKDNEPLKHYCGTEMVDIGPQKDSPIRMVCPKCHPEHIPTSNITENSVP